MKSYDHIVRLVFERPWAIRRSTLATITDIARRRVAGEMLTEAEIAARLAAAPQRQQPRREAGGIRVIPVHGVLMPHADLMTEMSGGTSTRGIQAMFREAIEDEEVGGVLFDFDTPGGLVDGIPELAADIRTARGTKPIVGFAQEAASAGYWIASQVDSLSIAPSGGVGSIGCYMAHDDASKFWEEFGVAHTFISYGDNKVQGNEYEPLSDHARERMQATVDYFGKMFDADVAAGRHVPESTVRDSYGQGDYFTPREALSLGMVDRIEPSDQAIGRLLEQTAQPAAMARRVINWGTEVAVDKPREAVAEAEELPTNDPRHEIAAVKDRIALRPHNRRRLDNRR